MQNCTHRFREMNLVLQRIQESQIKNKTVMIWSLQKKKKGIFCTIYFVQKNFFDIFCFISMYVVLNTLSEYTYFYISKSVTLYTLLPIFKIVESLQCIFKSSLFGQLNIEKLIGKEFLEPVIRNYFDISLVSETTLDSSFLGSQFSILGYRLFRKDRVRHGTGLILYVNQGIPPKTINTFNFPNSLEVLPLEINLRNKKILAIAAINLHHLMMNIFWISYTMLSVFIHYI